jgi:hypothetical protein
MTPIPHAPDQPLFHTLLEAMQSNPESHLEAFAMNEFYHQWQEHEEEEQQHHNAHYHAFATGTSNAMYSSFPLAQNQMQTQLAVIHDDSRFITMPAITNTMTDSISHDNIAIEGATTATTMTMTSIAAAAAPSSPSKDPDNFYHPNSSQHHNNHKKQQTITTTNSGPHDARWINVKIKMYFVYRLIVWCVDFWDLNQFGSKIR